MLKMVITGRSEVVAKVMFLLMSDSVHRGGGSPGRRHPQREAPLWKETPQETPCPLEGDPPEEDPPRRKPNPLQGDPPQEGDPQKETPHKETPLRSRLRHMVNERPVRVLLECILVV